MPRASTPSFVCTLPLEVPQDAERLLLDRMRVGARLHNVMVQHGRCVVRAMREDPAWEKALRWPKASTERRALFKALRETHGFSSAAFQRVAIAHKNAAGFSGRIGAHETQALAQRVFAACEQWVLGRRGIPRFKGTRRPLHSLEGKNNAGMLQWQHASCSLQVERGLVLRAKLPDLRRDEWMASALQAEAKYCRLVWRMHGSRRAWFVQLVLEGDSPVKATVLARLAPENSVAGLDLGVSTVAWATETAAGVERLAPSASLDFAQLRRLQRQLDRQRRANNPGNYNADGTPKRGARRWVASRDMRRTQAQLARAHALAAAHRKNEHGALTNRLLSVARSFKDDGVSPRSLQKNYGRAVSQRAPGSMLALLSRKAERAGGQLTSVDVRALKSSQYDHTSDSFEKKTLSERWHVFRDGRGRVQRDVYSAFLHLHAQGLTNNPQQLETAWLRVEASLRRAGLFVSKTRSEEPGSSCEFPLRARSSVSPPSPAHRGLSSSAHQAA